MTERTPDAGKTINTAPCEVDRDWRKCWRKSCESAGQCEAPTVWRPITRAAAEVGRAMRDAGEHQ